MHDNTRLVEKYGHLVDNDLMNAFYGLGDPEECLKKVSKFQTIFVDRLKDNS
jgi:hypothetical protein